jgi:hypothetical protein
MATEANRIDITMKEFIRNSPMLYSAHAPGTHPTSVLLLGPAGMGKTTLIEGDLPWVLSRAIEAPVEVLSFILTNREATEVAGYTIPYKDPETNKPRTARAMSDIAVAVHAAVNRVGPQGVVVLNLDELTNIDAMMQKVVADMLSAHRIGETQLPNNVWIIGTGNRKVDKTGFVRQLPHVINRRIELMVTTRVADWRDDFASPSQLPPIVVEFAETFAAELTNPKCEDEGPFLTFRSLTHAGWLIKAENERRGVTEPHALNTDSLFLKAAVEGLIGPAATQQLWSFVRLYGMLPTPAQIENNPHTAPVPPLHELGATFAVANLVINSMNVMAADQYIAYVSRLPRDLQARIIRRVNNSHNKNGHWVNCQEISRWLANPENAVLLSDAADY